MLGWLAGHLEILLRNLPSTFYRFTTTGGEEHSADVFGRIRNQTLG